MYGSADDEAAHRCHPPHAIETQISLPPMHEQSTSAAASSLGSSHEPSKEELAPLTTTNKVHDGGVGGISGGGVSGGRATLFSCIINLANTIVGAGMLGLPGAFGGTGYAGGSILIVLGASFSAHGLVLLSKAAQRAGLPSSFYTVAQAAVPQYTVLIDLAVALKCFGVATGYLITIGDCMVDALDHILLTGDAANDESFLVTTLLSRRFWVVGATLAVLPVSFYRTLDELKKTSALALIFVFLLAFGIIAYAYGLADPCYGEGEGCRGEVVPFTDGPTTLSKLPIFVFAFTCHQNIFPIVNEIQERTQARLNFVSFVSIGFALLLFSVVALEGYKTYGSNVRGDILLNYPETGKVTFLRVCIAFMLGLHYPLQLDPSRRCITSLVTVVRRWWQGKRDNVAVAMQRCAGNDKKEYTELSNINVVPSASQECTAGTSTEHSGYDGVDKAPAPTAVPGKGQDDDDGNSDRMFYAITISFLLLSFTIAMVVDDLGVILAMVGATGSTLVSYVLPGLIYVNIHPTMDASKVGAYVQLYMGCLIMPVALYFVMIGKVKE